MLKFEDDYLLAKLTTLQIGGPAKKFVAVKTKEELFEAIQYAQKNSLNYLVIGGGSNLLVSDEGVDCLVIKNDIKGIDVIPAKAGIYTNNTWIPDQVRDDKVTLSVKSGTPLQNLVDFTINNGLSGLQKLAGIPGTVGGAVYGNAGAYGQTISDHISSVVILESEATPESDSGQVCSPQSGPRMTLVKNQCLFNYRDSIFKKNQHIILEVTFRLEPGNPQKLQQEAQEVLAKRLIKYPPGIKCPGSFFKNIVASSLPKEILDKIPPEKIVYGKLPAGSLLEEVGAKGQSLDGIEISPNHANLFINRNGGTAKAFSELARIYALKVKEKFGIILEPEVQLINLPPLT